MSHSTVYSDWDPEQIVALLMECGEIALYYWGQERGQLKGDHTLVTRADHEIEEVLSSRLDAPEARRYLIGEETVDRKGEEYIQRALKGTTYVVDPIDGTAPYSHGLWHWGISIGRMQAARLTDGAVYLPVSGELFITDGNQVRHLRVSDGEVVSDAPVEPHPRALKDGGLIAIGQTIARYGRVRSRNAVQALATAVVPLAYIIQGKFGAYVSPLKLWDLAGALPMVVRYDFSVGTLEGGTFDLNVTEAHYFLAPGHPKRWRTRETLVVCHPGDEETLARCIDTSTG